MHPTILITSEVSGLVYINGAFSGEVRKDAPLVRPVSPVGALFVEYRPFPPLCLPCAQRLVFSGGDVLADSVIENDSLNLISWPFHITEIEIRPKRIYTNAPNIKTLSGAGRLFKFISSAEGCLLEIGSQGFVYNHALPRDAGEPLLASGDGVLFVSGALLDGGRYALILEESGKETLLSLSGSDVSFLSGGRILLTESAKDTAGHLIRTMYERKNNSYEEILREITPNPECEYRPLTPLDAALCVLECALLHLDEESGKYTSPAFRFDTSLLSILKSAGAAAPLRFTPPDGRSAAALLIPINENAAKAVPVYFRCEMLGGEWKVSQMSL